ncbi:hypothetical protein H6F67_01635 [Microcoleus sp. FACHB-1515]|uniref:hypothetical protein n=1 Tax=Cyanophyceae TaxID=3028117 RepID=UPI00168297EE|nr:hypothetical protein [Microcoleus sp. FACHB-1515]MBD2088570.1 hypothetical protein [Microcoleus sp. FACHB-1515]
MNTSDYSASERNDSVTPQIRSTAKIPGDNRTPIKHILIGTPQIVEFTTRRLEQAGYAQAIEWAQPLDLNEPLNLVPDPGDVISLLVRYMRFE